MLASYLVRSLCGWHCAVACAQLVRVACAEFVRELVRSLCGSGLVTLLHHRWIAPVACAQLVRKACAQLVRGLCAACAAMYRV